MSPVAKEGTNESGTSFSATAKGIAGMIAALASVAGLLFAGFTFGFSRGEVSVANESNDSTLVGDDDDESEPITPSSTEGVGPNPSEGSTEGSDLASTPSEVEQASLDISRLVDVDVINQNWRVSDLVGAGLADVEVDGAAVDRGLVFGLGASGAASAPVLTANFNLGRDYDRFKAVVGLMDQSLSDSPVSLEIRDTDTNVLWSGVVLLGESYEVDIPVVDVLRLQIVVWKIAERDTSWLVLVEPTLITEP